MDLGAAASDMHTTDKQVTSSSIEKPTAHVASSSHVIPARPSSDYLLDHNQTCGCLTALPARQRLAV